MTSPIATPFLFALDAMDLCYRSWNNIFFEGEQLTCRISASDRGSPFPRRTWRWSFSRWSECGWNLSWPSTTSFVPKWVPPWNKYSSQYIFQVHTISWTHFFPTLHGAVRLHLKLLENVGSLRDFTVGFFDLRQNVRQPSPLHFDVNLRRKPVVIERRTRIEFQQILARLL